MASSLADRFWSKVDIRGPDECWPWMGARQGRGYGRLQLGTRADGTRTMELAHRVAFELSTGSPPKDYVCHSCDNPPCCNPGHLWDGTQIDNMADMMVKGRGHMPPHTPGEAHPGAKLTEAQVIAILADPRSQRTIAVDYGMSQSQIGDIKVGKSWRHLSGKQA